MYPSLRFTSLWLLLSSLGLSDSRVPTTRRAFLGITKWQRKCDAPLSQSVGRSSTTTNVDRLLLTRRGGDQEKLTLDEKVRNAMRKLGLKSPEVTTDEAAADKDDGQQCEGGVCPAPAMSVRDETETSPSASSETSSSASVTSSSSSAAEIKEEDLPKLAQEIADSMNVHSSLAMAALGATAVGGETVDGNNPKTYNEEAARAMVQQELDIIANVSEDSAQVQQLVSEGFDSFLSRRALAFADMEMEDARAILLADQEDEREEEEQERERQQQLQKEAASPPPPPAPQEKPVMKTVTVDSSFDPTTLPATTTSAAPPSPASPSEQLTPAKKADVVFEATGAQIQELVLESPVPVLLDVYADWCGPCKVLGPILEDMAVKSGGLFRLVKVNSDNERAVSGVLEVTALPTVFGIRDGKIIHMFQGMPQSEEAMKSFMMGVLMPGGETNFSPPLTDQQKKKYVEQTVKLIKMAGAACFSFSARERLQDRIGTMLETLVEQTGGDPSIAEESASVVRSFVSNVSRNPTEAKFRRINLSNAVVKAKIVKYPAALAMLKVVGFSSTDGGASLTLGKGKKIVNVAPLSVARDSIDMWIDKSRYDIARAARKRKDEEDRKRLEVEGAFDKEDEEDDEEDTKDAINLDVCKIKLRMDGKKKVLDVELNADEPIKAILKHLPISVADDEEVRITCAAKRLVVKSSDTEKMNKSLRELRLSPAASVVVKLGTDEAASSGAGSGSKLAERAAFQREKKKGSHTMQSVGIYSKDDNAKGELIDGGGGVWYEHDVSDDEKEDEEVEPTEDASPDEKDDSDEEDEGEDEAEDEYGDEED